MANDLAALPHIPLGTYRHCKGNLYHLIGIARHSETLEPLAVYRALYGEGGLWVRPLAMFLETIEIDGETKPRFAFQGNTTTQEKRD